VRRRGDGTTLLVGALEAVDLNGQPFAAIPIP
jgi:hypothetical protein